MSNQTRMQNRYTQQQYLDLEQQSEARNEFVGGEIIAMAGASEVHTTITLNIGAEFRAHLKGGPCRAYTSDLRLKCEETGLYAYPDVMVVCNGPEFADGRTDTIRNPSVIVEVLSPSTEAFDRGKKFANYRTLPSLREYILVSQNEARVEQYKRKGDGFWLFSETKGQEEHLQLETQNLKVPMTEIYDGVSFQ